MEAPYRHQAKKSLGQNFLTNQGVIRKMRNAADPAKNDVILEIGPGLGALTGELLGAAGKVVAVEADRLLVAELGRAFAEQIRQGTLSLIQGDILKFDPETLKTCDDGLLKPYKIVANIPYHLTGAIIEKFLSASFQPSIMVLMIQKEVAERIIAKHRGTGRKAGMPGKESILSIAVKAYGTPAYISTVKAGSFSPAPAVDSAIIAVSDISRGNFVTRHHEEVFFQVVKAGFAHKRKTLAGNLKNILEPAFVDEACARADLKPNARAEDLGIKEWLLLSRFVYNETYGADVSHPTALP